MTCLSGLRILVAEDNIFVATDIADELERAGARVLGPVLQMTEAETTVSRGQVDLAVVEILLAGQTAYPLLARLRASGVPVLIASAYGRREIEPAFRSMPHIEKPFAPAQVVAALKRMAGTAGRLAPRQEATFQALSPV